MKRAGFYVRQTIAAMYRLFSVEEGKTNTHWAIEHAIKKFEEPFTSLKDKLQKYAADCVELQDDSARETSFIPAPGLLISQILADTVLVDYKRCPICRPCPADGAVERVLQRFTAQGHTEAELMLREARLQQHVSCCCPSEVSSPPRAIVHEASQFLRLIKDVQAQTTDMMKDLGLYDTFRNCGVGDHPVIGLEVLDRLRYGHSSQDADYPWNAWLIDCTGRTPLHRSIEMDLLGTEYDHLLERATDAGELDLADLFGRSPLHIACQKGHSDVVKKLIAKGADIHACTPLGSTPLHYAAASGWLEICEILASQFKPNSKCLTAGQFVNSPDYYGRSALFYAVRSKRRGIVKTLMDISALWNTYAYLTGGSWTVPSL
jgi:hypothetical protein